MAEKPILGLDVYSGNYYSGFSMDAKGMADHGFRYILVKSSMGGGLDYSLVGGKKFDTVGFFTKYFRDAGFDTGGLYHWADQTQDAKRQVGFFLEQVAKYKPDVLEFDWEQWWDNWQQWNNANARKITWADVARSKPAKIVNALTAMIAEIEAELPEPRIPILVYTFSWFLETYCGAPAKWPWPAPYNRPHLAAYPNIAPVNIICETWDEFDELITGYIAKINPIDFAGGRPHGLSREDWTWWQFQSSIVLPGAKRGYDMSIFNGGEAEYRAWLRREPPAPPVYFGQLPAAEKFMVLERHLKKAGDVGQDGEVLI